jgi:hypothetical protein
VNCDYYLRYGMTRTLQFPRQVFHAAYNWMVMIRLTFIWTALCTLLLQQLLLVGCTDGQSESSSSDANTASVASVPAAGSSSELVVKEHVIARIPSPVSNTGVSNYSRSGAMLIGGEVPSGVTYEFGMLHAGDRVLRLQLELGEGRKGADACLVSCALSGDSSWQEFNMGPAQAQQVLEFTDAQLGARADCSLFVKVETKSGEGIALRSLQAQFDLSSTEAVSLELKIPALDAVNTNIRIPMRALDLDGRVARRYGGIAEMIVNRDESILHIPVAFVGGFAEIQFQLSEVGEYAVEFRSELSETLRTTLTMYQPNLPVYEIGIQQVRPMYLDSTDLGATPTTATCVIDASAAMPVMLTGNALIREDSPKRSLRLEFPEGWQDDQAGYLRRTVELRASEFDPTQLRDLLAGWLYQQAGAPGLRLRPVHLRINGCYQGVFIEAEYPDAAWMKTRGWEAGAEVYVMHGVGGLNPSENIAYFDDLFHRVAEPDGGMEQLQEFLHSTADIFANVEEHDRLDRMSELVDRDVLYSYFAAQSMVSANDNWRRFYAVINNGAQTGSWSLMATEGSLSFGITEGNNPVVNGYDFTPLNDIDMIGGIDDNIVLRTLFSNTDSQILLRDIINGLLDGVLSEQQVLHRLDELYALMEPDLLADPFTLVLQARYAEQLEYIRENIRQHWAYLRAEANAVNVDADASHEGHEH